MEGKNIINSVLSSDNYWDIGMRFGIVLAIISLLGISDIKISFLNFSFNYVNQFDWWIVFLLGVGIFFFFMAIRLNTEISENKSSEDFPDENRRSTRKDIVYQTYLNKFNVLSKSCFIISILFGMLSLARLLLLLVSS